MVVAWLTLALAIALEVTATLSLRAAGVGHPSAVTLVVVGYVGSFVCLYVVLKRIDVSVAYAVWAGAGTAVIAGIGMLALGEAASVVRLGSIALIIVGVIGLSLTGAH